MTNPRLVAYMDQFGAVLGDIAPMLVEYQVELESRGMRPEQAIVLVKGVQELLLRMAMKPKKQEG